MQPAAGFAGQMWSLAYKMLMEIRNGYYLVQNLIKNISSRNNN